MASSQPLAHDMLVRIHLCGLRFAQCVLRFLGRLRVPLCCSRIYVVLPSQLHIAQPFLPIASDIHPLCSFHFLTLFLDAFSVLLGVYLFSLSSTSNLHFLYDYIDRGISRAVDVFNTDYEILYKLVEDKMNPIIDKIKKEFHRSEEYKACRAREKLEKAHQKAKKQFGEQYGVDPDEYDYVYNIFGELMDKPYLDRIVRQYEQQQKAYERRYQEYSYSTYSGGGGGGYSVPARSTYTEEETAILKQFYRSLSKTYHPDLNPGTDTTAAMHLLNKLKETWGV